MKSGKVLKAFPFAFDGINVAHVSAGSTFPPAGRVVSDSAFDGLAAAGYVEQSKADEGAEDAAINRRIVEAFDRRLSASSDQELKDIIARSGTPYSGNLIHANMVAAAKRQLVAEMEGAEPVRSVDPNAGVTEQPLAKPGQATPPSAAAAVEQQKAQANAAGAGGGENKATDQFGQPLHSGGQPASEAKYDEMTVAELKEHAEKQNIDLGDATKKADIIAAIQAAK